MKKKQEHKDGKPETLGANERMAKGTYFKREEIDRRIGRKASMDILGIPRQEG